MVKPFLCDKNTIFSFRTFSEDTVRSLIVKPDKYYLSDTENLSDPSEIAIRKFENHPSVQAIKQNISISKDFISLTLKSVIYLRKLKAPIIKRMAPLVISQKSS